MTPTQSSIVWAARAWIDTPYAHQGRVKGVGVDCVGLLIGVAKDLGKIAPDWDVTGYARVPDGVELMHHLEERFDTIAFDDMRPGDFVCIAFAAAPQHVGVVGDYAHGGFSFIHAASKFKRVVEHRLLFSRQMRFVSAFRFK